MTLKEQVRTQVQFMGKTPGGQKLVLCGLLNDGRDIFQFMQLFSESAIKKFYHENREEVDRLCSEEDEMTAAAELTGAWEQDHLKLAFEKILMVIESEIKG